MTVAVGAYDFDSHHPMTRIAMFADSLLGERRPETRPTRPRIVLGIGMKQFRSAAGAGVNTALFVVGVGTREGALSTLVTRDLVGER